MIQGRFGNPSHRPLIAAYVSSGKPVGSTVIRCPGIVSFLADTGADCSVLSLPDADRLQVDFDQAPDDIEINALAGKQQYRRANIRLVFHDDNGMLRVYWANLAIMSPATNEPGIYSLLGRDVMDHWATTFARCWGRLSAEVVSTDFSIPEPTL